jgi:Eukaryotic membrane protein family
MVTAECPTSTLYNLNSQQSCSSDPTQSPSHSDDEGRLKFGLPSGTTQETIPVSPPGATGEQNGIGAQKEGEGAATTARDSVDSGRSLPRYTEALNNLSTTATRSRSNTTEAHKRRQSQVEEMAAQGSEREKILKFSTTRIHELTSSPEMLPLRAIPNRTSSSERLQSILSDTPSITFNVPEDLAIDGSNKIHATSQPVERSEVAGGLKHDKLQDPPLLPAESPQGPEKATRKVLRPSPTVRSMSTPLSTKTQSRSTRMVHNTGRTSNTDLKGNATTFDFGTGKLELDPSAADMGLPSPMPTSIPGPPLSIATYLQLELSSRRPSSLYIHRSATSDFPYESSRVRIERLLNFIFLPYHLEGALWFGTLACFDAWLYTFTILPLRLLKSFYILSESWSTNLVSEAQFIAGFVYTGTGRVWRRRQSRRFSASEIRLNGSASAKSQKPDRARANSLTSLQSRIPQSEVNASASKHDSNRDPPTQRRHRRAKSVPSALLPDDKADILKGFLIICTCLILMRFDASRMYHWIRGQAAIKLYVIYNVLEVCDRLFSAIGQDVLECLFSRETLERKPDGHSKILRPFWLFLLALIYTVVHATSLFYQAITLNVAVNSYSNALITLLISNQFVEIKSTVFKKFEKENLFQLACADIVERFQLWLMLTIIASRNIVETGGLSRGLSALSPSTSMFAADSATNSSNPLTKAMPPRSSPSILPRSFELVPAFFSSLTAYAPTMSHVFGPFLVVLGSEMLVDWLKHAYINKFNNTRPAIYGRFLDILAKDYYSNAFGDQNLTKRLGLPVIPLSCLFIRASMQTYHMFLAAWIPTPVPSSATTLASLQSHHTASTSRIQTSTVVALSQKLDDLLRTIPSSISSLAIYRHFTTAVVIILLFLVLLAVKLVLGMLLLSYSRSRYRSMKEREKTSIHDAEGGNGVGGWGIVEVDENKRRWIYEDDADGLKALKEREARDRMKKERGTGEAAFDKVKRYEMVAKRIW